MQALSWCYDRIMLKKLGSQRKETLTAERSQGRLYRGDDI